MVFGVLLVTGTTVREAPQRLREFFGAPGPEADYRKEPAGIGNPAAAVAVRSSLYLRRNEPVPGPAEVRPGTGQE
ncbi:hypothetical protein [Nocardia sp. CA-290969]|uniref:hypothetical protein n=1 Tax=Nocardia sp. CA-290969 TaxID=3239986 RepID=UPI003D94F8ED